MHAGERWLSRREVVARVDSGHRPVSPRPACAHCWALEVGAGGPACPWHSLLSVAGSWLDLTPLQP